MRGREKKKAMSTRAEQSLREEACHTRIAGPSERRSGRVKGEYGVARNG